MNYQRSKSGRLIVPDEGVRGYKPADVEREARFQRHLDWRERQRFALAIGFGSAIDLGNNGGSGALSGAFNNVAGTVMWIGGVGDSCGSGADDVIAPTYNGVSATLVAKRTPASATSNRMAYLYCLNNPATGSHTLSVTSTTNHFLLFGAVTYTGAATTGQPDASAVSDSGANSASWPSALVTNADNCWVICLATQVNVPGAGTGFTQRTKDAAFGTWQLGDSNGVITPAGSFSQTTTAGGGSWIFHIQASIAPPAAPGGYTNWDEMNRPAPSYRTEIIAI